MAEMRELTYLWAISPATSYEKSIAVYNVKTIILP